MTELLNSNSPKKLYFSLFSGELYEVDAKEVGSLDAFQIPLVRRPSTSCKKCHGRFYEGYLVNLKHYQICTKCAKKIIDVVALQQTGKYANFLVNGNQ